MERRCRKKKVRLLKKKESKEVGGRGDQGTCWGTLLWQKEEMTADAGRWVLCGEMRVTSPWIAVIQRSVKKSSPEGKEKTRTLQLSQRVEKGACKQNVVDGLCGFEGGVDFAVDQVQAGQ